MSGKIEAKETAVRAGNGMGVASMVLGIVGLVMFWVPFLNLIMSGLATIFGAIGLKTEGRGMAIAGLVMGLLVLLPLLMFVIFIIFIGAIGSVSGV